MSTQKAAIGAQKIESNPELYEAELDDRAFRRLIQDLDRGADILDILIKREARAMSAMEEGNLRTVADGLRKGRIRSAQIRYRYQGKEWRDTLLQRKGEKIRLIRMAMPSLEQ